MPLINPVRYISAPQRLLYYSALRICSVEHRNIAESGALASNHIGDGVGNHHPLLLVCYGFKQFYLLSLLSSGEAGLLKLRLVVVYKGVGSLNYNLGAAVVLVQLILCGIGKILLEIEDILYSCAAEGIYALRIISYHGNISVPGRELAHYEVLRHIGILELIHKDISEAAAYALKRIGKIPEENVCIEEQVVKVHYACHFAALPVELVYIHYAGPLGDEVLLLQHSVGEVCLWGYKVVLGVGDALLHLLRLIYLVIQLQLFYAALYYIAAICGIVYCKILGEAKQLCLISQKPCKYGVKSAHPEPPCPGLAHREGYSLLHLRRSLICKSKRQYLPWRRTFFYNIGNLAGKDSCFSRSRTRYY